MKKRIIFMGAAVITGLLLAVSGSVLAAKGGIPGPPNGGEEGAGNRLSYPAILIPGLSIDPFFMVAEGTLGETYSYGCEGTETLEQFSYDNISCVDDLANPTVYYTADQCTAVGGKCEGKTVDRIYWQKEELNDWSAQVTGVSDLESLPIPVRFLDWGDSIEVVNWNENSVLRVETQPFADLSQDPLVELPAGTPQTQVGFGMWHVSGQGITEQWGVRVTEDLETGLQGLPYVYQSPYAIINGGTADLYLSKLFRADADDADYACPEMGGDLPPVYPVDYGPDADGYTFPGRTFIPGEGWTSACNLPVVPYTLEQSVSGKFVHGYNWRMRELTDPLPEAYCEDPVAKWSKTGWWRLTFVPNGGADKMQFIDTTVTNAPVVPTPMPTDITTLAEESEDETTLYTPAVDPTNNLTYIDICIVGKTKGGGGGGGKGGGKGPPQ